MTLASENYRSGQPISEYIQNNLAPHFSPDLINPQHFCHSARRKPVRLSKSGLREPAGRVGREVAGEFGKRPAFCYDISINRHYQIHTHPIIIDIITFIAYIGGDPTS